MRRRIAIIVSLGLLAIVAVLILILQSSYLPDKIEKKITPLVEEAIGRRIKFSGSYISLFPFYWQIYNAGLSDPKTGDVLLKSKDITIYISPLKLLLDEVSIKDIRFKEPNLSIIRYSDGKTNLEGLFPEKKPTKWKVVLKKISISKGTIQFNDLLIYKNIVLSAVDCRILPDLDKKLFAGTITAEGSYRDQKISQQGIKMKGDAAVDLKDKKKASIKVSGLNVSTPGGTVLKADGVVAEDGLIDLNGKVALSLKDIAELSGKKKDLHGTVIFTGSVTGTIKEPAVKGNITTDSLSYDKVSYGKVKGELSYKERLLHITKIKGDILNGSVKGDMEVDFRNSIPSYRMQMKAENVQPHKVIERYMADLKVPIEKKGLINADAEVRGEGLNKDTIVGKGWISYKDKNQNISLSGGINKGLDINAGLTGELTDIAGYLHIPHFPLHGIATLNGEVSGVIAKPVISGTIMMSKGVVKDTVFDTVTAGLRLAAGELLLQPVVLRKEDAVYSLYGSIRFRSPEFKDPYFDLKGDISHGNPNDFISIFYKTIPLDMSADGHASINGDSQDLQWFFDLKSSSGAIYNQRFDSSEITFSITKDRVIFDRITLKRGSDIADGKGWLGFSDEYKDEFHADISSERFSIENFDLLNSKTDLLKGSGSFNLSAGGKINNPAIEITMQVPHLFIKDTDTGFARLTMSKDTGDMTVSGQVLNMSYEGNITWEEDAAYKISGHLLESNMAPVLNLINPAFSKKVSVKTSGEVVVEGKIKEPDSLRVSVVLSRFNGVYSDYKIENDGEIKLVYEGKRLTLESVRIKGDGTYFNVTGSLNTNGDNNIFINGEADLRLLSLFTPEIKYSKGNVYIAFLISGELADPSIQGGLAIKDGTVRSTTLRQTLENVNVSIFFNGHEIILESMQGAIGGGGVSGSGKLEFKELNIKEFGIVIEVADAVFRYPEGLESRLDGTFVLQGTQKSKGIKGEISVKKVTYDKNINLRTMVLELQKKKIKVDQPVPVFGDTELNIHISGKKDIWINNNLAKVPLEADLMLKGTIDHPLLFGRVEARDGTFTFSRNPFKVISATADFASPDTIKPVLDIHASTDVREYKIDMRLTGTMDRFNLYLSSDPVLSETDILALMTVGQTAAEAAETMKSVGTVEATAFLAAPIQEKLEGTLQDIIKVDRFQVEPYYSNTSASGGARLTVGKKLLDDRLYVTYTTGITTVEELIKLEYFLGKNVYVVGERDELGRMSGDIKFRFEFR
ncbi:MAG: translocation/assembly module TamB domain-containing protein [Nitrospirae bacterium]|nr:translocation/assembly module TamB domain-containing protein [Nitrospirota bacterium]